MADLREDKISPEDLLHSFTEKVAMMADEELGDRFITVLGIGIINEDDTTNYSHGMRTGESFPTHLAFKLVAEINQRSVNTLIDDAFETGEMGEPT